MTKHIRMYYDNWVEEFKPQNSKEESGMFETFGEDLEFVLHIANNKDNRRVWTLMDGDNGMSLVEGYHLVNRVGYYITEKPAPEGYTFEIWDEAWDYSFGKSLEELKELYEDEE